ncbi:hypothetical protein F5X98DRAFT_374443 [Xylaria grammica]|nr:hypothetical protein F5X98DRAFT_374443 [Xylaria grammica]
MPPSSEPKNWYRGEFLLSTEQRLLQVDAIHEAMGSDVFWWAQAIPRDALLETLQNSLCFGLYELPQSTSQIAGKPEANWANESDHGQRDFRVPHRRVRAARVPGKGAWALDVKLSG